MGASPLFEKLEIPGLMLVTPKKWGDDRGYFSETHNASAWETACRLVAGCQW